MRQVREKVNGKGGKVEESSEEEVGGRTREYGERVEVKGDREGRE